jgi:hypothetical protein
MNAFLHLQVRRKSNISARVSARTTYARLLRSPAAVRHSRFCLCHKLLRHLLPLGGVQPRAGGPCCPQRSLAHGVSAAATAHRLLCTAPAGCAAEEGGQEVVCGGRAGALWGCWCWRSHVENSLIYLEGRQLHTGPACRCNKVALYGLHRAKAHDNEIVVTHGAKLAWAMKQMCAG